jgi:hypothetical protein
MKGENPTNYILINSGSESEIDLIRNLGASQVGLRFFISTTARIKSAIGPLGPGFRRRFGENSSRYFRPTRAR